ncbi:MAG: hopanoid-associated sugar epimerase [Rhizobiaceae bacterium]
MPEGGRILVTGGSGFVGSALLRKLARGGSPVRALVRPGSRLSPDLERYVELVRGDIRDASSVHTAMRNVRRVYHAAADYRLWSPDPNELFETNVGGTRTIMEEAMRAGVERVVYTSSVATLACNRDRQPADETRSLDARLAVGGYKRSKIMAETLVRSMAAKGLPAIIVNPATPVGAWDVKPTPTGRIIIEAAAGRMPCFVETGLNMVHVDDVAEGHLAAMERGRIGERYILGGQDRMLRDILAAIAKLTGRSPPRFRIPRSLVFPVAVLAEAAARRTGRTPFVTRDGLRMSRNYMFFSSAKAERELGYRARPYERGIEDAISWFRKAGYL